ncbi:HNH/ENDO VII family nuclease [uncultured Brachyspira sp.]|uniref:HNH/ENDO VII family nuclease n=1 Tax=uncultured Brachyspira sp. TaxID=221953 RepID=UPI00261605D9|nr:HNH/ENDO VII family nuclease [uncultured Brachyspira sp.]
MFERISDNLEAKKLNIDERTSVNEIKNSKETSREIRDQFVRSPEETKKIEENSPFSKEINDNIRSKEELDIYKNAPLKEGEVNGKATLERTDIDYKQIDEDIGKTNLELMKDGYAPLDKNGNPIELHHIGQKSDYPLAELTKQEHRGKENNTILHDVKKESEIDRDKFNKERSDYWKARAEQVESQIKS